MYTVYTQCPAQTDSDCSQSAGCTKTNKKWAPKRSSSNTQYMVQGKISRSSHNKTYVGNLNGNSGLTGSLIAFGSFEDLSRTFPVWWPRGYFRPFGCIGIGEICSPDQLLWDGSRVKPTSLSKQTNRCNIRSTGFMWDTYKYTGLVLLFPLNKDKKQRQC